MQFDFIASTGRTATTWLATVLNGVDGVTACHEGYTGSDKDAEPLLPLINLENAQAYARASSGDETVADKRSPAALAAIPALAGVSHLIDVAYYNAILSSALLAGQPRARMLGIVRDPESFVRSSTTISGEDPLPVGWADPAKPLTDREKFIAMGRIRPRRGSPEKANWDSWSAIRRNIWLWRETNLAIANAQARHPDRVKICHFDTFRAEPDRFWATLAAHFDLPIDGPPKRATDDKAVNRKPSGYQIGPAIDWTDQERAELADADQMIRDRIVYEC